MFTIRKAQLSDLNEMQQLFVDTINSICAKDYTSEQINVWTSSVENTSRWLDTFTNQFLLVAEKNGKIVGYGSLENNCYIDFLYVHKDFQRQGIANRLYTELENEAKKYEVTCLTSDVSKTARPFFEIKGFNVFSEQKKNIGGVEIINYKMEKPLIQLSST